MKKTLNFLPNVRIFIIFRRSDILEIFLFSDVWLNQANLILLFSTGSYSYWFWLLHICILRPPATFFDSWWINNVVQCFHDWCTNVSAFVIKTQLSTCTTSNQYFSPIKCLFGLFTFAYHLIKRQFRSRKAISKTFSDKYLKMGILAFQR